MESGGTDRGHYESGGDMSPPSPVLSAPMIMRLTEYHETYRPLVYNETCSISQGGLNSEVMPFSSTRCSLVLSSVRPTFLLNDCFPWDADAPAPSPIFNDQLAYLRGGQVPADGVNGLKCNSFKSPLLSSPSTPHICIILLQRPWLLFPLLFWELPHSAHLLRCH